MRNIRRAAYAATVLFVLALVCPTTVLAQGGPELRVNTYTTGTQGDPRVAADASGNFVVVWESDGQDGDGVGVFAQRFDATGVANGAEFQVNTFTANNQWRPAIASDSLGNFVIVWDSNGQDGSGFGVYGQRYGSSGSPLGSEIHVSSNAPYSQRVASVAEQGSAAFLVSWDSSSQDGSSEGVFGQFFDASGSASGSEIQVNTHTTGLQQLSSTGAGGGTFVVVWQSDGQDGAGMGIFGQRFDDSGTPIGSEFQVNSYTTGDQTQPVVGVDDAGGFVVVWVSAGQDGSGTGIYGQRFDAAGDAIGPEFRVNSTTANDQTYPAIAVRATGQFAVVWESDLQDGSGSGIYGQQYDAAGNPLGDELRINSTTAGDQQYPSVAGSEDGKYVVAWASGGDVWAAQWPRLGAPIPTLTWFGLVLLSLLVAIAGWMVTRR